MSRGLEDTLIRHHFFKIRQSNWREVATGILELVTNIWKGRIGNDTSLFQQSVINTQYIKCWNCLYCFLFHTGMKCWTQITSNYSNLYFTFSIWFCFFCFLGLTECNFSGRSGTQQCFGAVGQLLIFHLPNAPNTEVRLTKDDKYLILKIVKNQIETAHKEYTNLSDRFTNGTIKLGKAMKRHSGDYLLEEFGSNGASLKKVKVHLQIQGRWTVSGKFFWLKLSISNYGWKNLIVHVKQELKKIF